MNHRSKPMHRTTTSAEVKNRWNAAHYDRVVITVPIGARDEIKAAAAAHGLSVAAYIRMLVIRDTAENPENTRFLRGGGGSLMPGKRCCSSAPESRNCVTTSTPSRDSSRSTGAGMLCLT